MMARNVLVGKQSLTCSWRVKNVEDHQTAECHMSNMIGQKLKYRTSKRLPYSALFPHESRHESFCHYLGESLGPLRCLQARLVYLSF